MNKPINKKKAVKSRVKKTWLFNKLLSISAVLVVVLVIGWMGLSHRHMIIAKLFPAKSASVSQQQSISSKQNEHANHAKTTKTPVKSKRSPQRRASEPRRPSGTTSFQNPSNQIRSQRSLPGQPQAGNCDARRPFPGQIWRIP